MYTYPISGSDICTPIQELGNDEMMAIKSRSLKYATSFILQ